MAIDIFAKIGDIKVNPSTTNTRMKSRCSTVLLGCHECREQWELAVEAAPGKTTFQDLSIVHKIDKASPKLLQACAMGEHVKEATITHRREGKVSP